MTRHRTPYAIALAFVALIASSIAAGAAPTRATGATTPTAVRQPSGSAQEYVVAFTGSPDAAAQAVTQEEGEGMGRSIQPLPWPLQDTIFCL